MKIDPRYMKFLRELNGDSGVTDDDHELVSKMLSQWEIQHMVGRGRLNYNGEWAPSSRNKLLDKGPKILMNRLFVESPTITIPNWIVLGKQASPSYVGSAPGCQTVISDGTSGFGGISPVVADTFTISNTTLELDTCVLTYDYETLSDIAGEIIITEMALRNADETPLNYNWIENLSPKTVNIGGTLIAEMTVQAIA